MSEIQLEVGKVYEVRDPEYAISQGVSPTETIIGYREGSYFSFIGDHYGTYTPEGKEYDLEESPFDLVKEVTNSSKP